LRHSTSASQPPIAEHRIDWHGASSSGRQRPVDKPHDDDDDVGEIRRNPMNPSGPATVFSLMSDRFYSVIPLLRSPVSLSCCLSLGVTTFYYEFDQCSVKAEFHYASWFEAGRRQVRSQISLRCLVRTSFEPAPNQLA